MSVVLQPNYQTTPSDFFLYIRDTLGNLVDPAEIMFTVYRADNSMAPVQVRPASPATRLSTGYYWADFQIPEDYSTAEYHLVFSFRQVLTDPVTLVMQRFFIWEQIARPNHFSENTFKLVRQLRTLLRDNNPDRNYHFRPPTHAEDVTAYTRRIGYIWEDVELATYLDMSLNMVNLAPPLTGYTPDNLPLAWETILIYGAAVNALTAITLNWIEEEFNYSIGGVSLDIQKSSKYQSMLSTLSDRFDKMQDKAKATVKFVTGLRQARYALSIQGYVGPYSSRGDISVRNYTASSYGATY